MDLRAVASRTLAKPSGSTIALIAEAKATGHLRGLKDLERLRRIRTLMGERHDVSGAKLAIFSMFGFTDDLMREVGEDVLVFGLDDLFSWK